MKINVVVTAEKGCNVFASIPYRLFRVDYNQHLRDYEGDSLPSFEIVDFFKGMVQYAVYKDELTVFISGQLPAKELGRIEHCIYMQTGLRGDAIKVTYMEFLGSPNTPLKKYLLRRS